jgi:hypothetical protein
MWRYWLAPSPGRTRAGDQISPARIGEPHFVGSISRGHRNAPNYPPRFSEPRLIKELSTPNLQRSISTSFRVEASAMGKNIHEIRDPIHVFIRLDSHEREVLNSRPFQRLRHIHQLALTSARAYLKGHESCARSRRRALASAAGLRPFRAGWLHRLQAAELRSLRSPITTLSWNSEIIPRPPLPRLGWPGSAAWLAERRWVRGLELSCDPARFRVPCDCGGPREITPHPRHVIH